MESFKNGPASAASSFFDVEVLEDFCAGEKSTGGAGMVALSVDAFRIWEPRYELAFFGSSRLPRLLFRSIMEHPRKPVEIQEALQGATSISWDLLWF